LRPRATSETSVSAVDHAPRYSSSGQFSESATIAESVTLHRLRLRWVSVGHWAASRSTPAFVSLVSAAERWVSELRFASAASVTLVSLRSRCESEGQLAASAPIDVSVTGSASKLTRSRFGQCVARANTPTSVTWWTTR